MNDSQQPAKNSIRQTRTSIRGLMFGVAVWTMIVEALTCLLRFGLRLESTRDTASTIGRLTFGVRIHHSYIGILLLPIAFIVERRWPRLSRWLLIAGLSLLFSDLIHHFIVLWLITGSPQFDLLY